MLYTILIGLVAGALAKFIMPGRDPGGIIVTILLGIAGSIIATYLGQIAGFYEPGESARFIGSTVGAILILWIYRIFLKKKAAST
ncbi:MAG: GlsB/YeaQ/YmgE family stress response membrane protein [candidate division KSB1 bacterium]|nr:GlsB/YeaQ/YmgE family stress response membrane protein [candidate division KSB1 bacterium]MDZ7300877.1 GlsB/YeaQ/YmgE family stress response membrane protein [candidate division KSB1 bacterium]MDZ7309853.1 GlsB/YeaQ/YmgE family stress response membrane protein [candidate division KSB1 bacterium]